LNLAARNFEFGNTVYLFNKLDVIAN
jgi:hypothetical protein